MFNLFRKSSPTNLSKGLVSLLNMIDTFYSSSEFNIPQLDIHLRLRASLFTYGVIDSYCQASHFSNDDSNSIYLKLEPQIKSRINFSLNKLMKSQIIKLVFSDNFLLDIISVGGTTYNDFLSGDSQRGGMSLRRFGSLVGLWKDIPQKDIEKQILREYNL